MKKSSIKVSNIELDVNGKKIDLTVQEAKDLYNELKLFFNKEKEIIYVPTSIPCQPSPPYRPIEPYYTRDTTPNTPFPDYPIITCESEISDNLIVSYHGFDID